MSQYFHEDDVYKGHLDLRLWRRIFAHTRAYRGALIGLGVSGGVIAGTDALFPLMIGFLIDEAVGDARPARLWLIGGAYAGLFAIFAFNVWLFIRLAGRVATGVAFDLRRKAFAKLQELSFSYYDVRPVGWLITRLTSDVSKVSGLIPWFALDLVWGTCLISGIVIAMFLLSPSLALAVLCIVPPLAIASIIFQKKLLASQRLVRKTNSQMTAGFNECIMGVRTTKSLVRESENLAEFQTLSSDMYRYSMRNALQSAVYLPLVITLGSAGVGLALWRGGYEVGAFGLSLGTLVAFMQYAALFYMPIQELAERFTQLQAAQAAAERVQTLLDEVPAVRDTDEVAARVSDAAAREDAAVQPLRANQAEDGHDAVIETIEFRDVTFWYKEGEPVLREFNLTVRGGETIALVGPTGGGKSTIVSLAARFYEPSEGGIFINGVEYRDRSLAWFQSQLGVVLQTPHLFSGTIRENVRYGRLDASDAEVEEAARIANAHAFIVELDKGYDTEVGEGGSKLSTGQRQLVSLARAVLADPQIFIMDEATSSVDTETERLIQSAIERLLEGRIAFVIAHRLSTVRRADQILVIDGGRVVEQGRHSELIRRRGRYHALYTKQFAREREEAVLSGAK